MASGDNWEIIKNGVKQAGFGQGCFSEFNRIITEDAGIKSITKASIIIPKEYLQFFSEENRNLYLKEIQKIGVLPFTTETINEDLYINFKINKLIYKHSYLCYSGMLIRCLYKNNNDDFRKIAKHFIQMCKYFPKKNRGLLFTTACNIGRLELFYFNSNHILMFNICKILDSNKIINILDKNNGINSNFSDIEYTFANLELNYNLIDDSKKSYEIIMKKNGIKSTKK